MSYPSIAAVLEERGLDPADTAQAERALLAAFDRDLPLGMAYLRRLAAEVRTTGRRVLRPEDPNSPVGKQLIRLLGTDVARGLVSRETGIAYGLYNCCGVVAAGRPEDLSLTPQEQIRLQNGDLASADC